MTFLMTEYKATWEDLVGVCMIAFTWHLHTASSGYFFPLCFFFWKGGVFKGLTLMLGMSHFLLKELHTEQKTLYHTFIK
jgi:hypothetical protein